MRNHDLKLERAEQHLRSLQKEVHDWLQKDPYTLVHEFDSQVGKNVLRVEDTETPPADFALILGDCLHNLRSALDNLVYELIVACHGDPPPAELVKRSEFPIFGDKVMNAGERKKKIGGIDPGAQAEIEGLQPHNRGQNYESDPLWRLHQLSNVDKHRLPHFVLFKPIAAAYHSSSFGVIGPQNIEWRYGPIEDGAIVALYDRPAGISDAEMNMYFSPLFSIGFGHGLPIVENKWVLRELVELRNHITKEVLPLLIPYLT